MIISHKHKFIFFKPLKCAGSSVELSLIPHCGDEDIITGSGYEDELIESNFLYVPRNNLSVISQAINGSDTITEVAPIYHTHTTPSALRDKHENYSKISDYYHFSIVRNPFDALVSYFWWSFYGPDIAKLSLVTDSDGKAQLAIVGKDKSVKYDYNFGKVVTPMTHDSDTVLKIKFQQFLESESNFTESVGIGSENQTGNILSWFAKLQMDFCNDNVEDALKFESLSQDLQRVCDRFEIKLDEIPRLKSGQRKVNKPYSIYYNSYTKELAHDAFDDIIKKFNYRF